MMMPPSEASLPDHKIFRWGLVTLSLASLALVALGLTRYLSLMSTPGIRLAYATVIILGVSLPGLIGFAFTHPRWPSAGLVLHRGAPLGLVLGIIWSVQILAARLALSAAERQVTGLALIAIAGAGTIFIAGGSAFFTSRRTGRLTTGLQIGAWGGLVAGLMAFICVLLLAYLLAGSRLAETQVIQAFQQSGETNPLAWYFWDQLSGAAAYLLMASGLSTSAGLLGGLAGFIWYSPRIPA
jgi:hypothetical protein